MRATQLLMEEHELILRGLRLLEAVANRGGPVPPALLEFLTGFADAHHHGKEEKLLFPAMEEAGFPHDAGPVGVMLHEHTQGRALIAAMRDPEQFTDAALAYSALLQAHIDKENQILFRMADQAIPREQQRQLDEAVEEYEQASAKVRAQHEAAIARLEKEISQGG